MPTENPRRAEDLQVGDEGETRVARAGDTTGLLPHHRKHLKDGGLEDRTISEAGIWSVTNADAIKELIGWFKSGLIPSMALPVRDIWGHIVATALRPDVPISRKDGRSPKYEWPRNAPSRLGFAPPSLVETAIYRDVTFPLLLTEGTKKMLSITQTDCHVAPIASLDSLVWSDVLLAIV